MSPVRAGAVAAVLLTAGAAGAKDYGQAGPVFAIVEPDLLAVLERRLRSLQQSGAIDRANARFARSAERQIRRPAPVPGLHTAERARSWFFDPSVTLDHDIHDQKGNLIARRGQRLNPLDFVTLRQALVFVDGDDPRALAWATRQFAPAGAKLIFVAGSPIEAMDRLKRRVYFDQSGQLTRRFGITSTPALVVQDGPLLRVSEIPLRDGGAG